MVAAIGNKNAEKALDIYNNMLLAKESPFGINKMIARQFRLILQCKYVAVKKKYNNAQIANELGLREFIVRDCMAQSKNFDIKLLINAIKDCAQTDTNIKKGLITDELGVELLIIKYSSNRQ
jgi:DNA polymerase-3 subunit delta